MSAMRGVQTRINSALTPDRGWSTSLRSTVVSGMTSAARAGAIGVAAAMTAAGGWGFQLAAEAEQADVAFTNLLGSSQAAGDYLQQLRDFAARTPFEFPDLRDAASRFVAVGVEADRVIPIMTTLGDATSAMGTGAEGIARATTALTQMQQKGKVSAEEMLQLTEAGIPAWDALASVLGVTVVEAQEMVTARQVEANDVFRALETTAGPALQRVTGQMETQSRTLTGMLSTLKDIAGQKLATALEPAADIAKAALPQLTESLGSALTGIGPGLEDLFTGLGELIPPLLAAIAPLAGMLATVLGGAMRALGPALAALAPSLTAIGLILTNVLLQVFEELRPVLPELVTAIGELAVVLALGLADALIALIPVIPPLARLLTMLVQLIAMVPPSAIKAIALGWLAVNAALWLLSLNPVVLIIAGIAALAAGLVLAYQKIEPFRNAVDSVVDVFQAAPAAVMRFVEPVKEAGQAVLRFLSPLREVGRAMFAYLLEPVRTVVDVVTRLIHGDFSGAFRSLAGFPVRMLRLLGTVFSEVGQVILRNLATIVPRILGWIAATGPRLAIGFGGWVVHVLAWVTKFLLLLPLRLAAIAIAFNIWIITTAVKVGIWFNTKFVPAMVMWVARVLIALPGQLLRIVGVIWRWVTSTGVDLAARIIRLHIAFMTWPARMLLELPGALLRVGGVIWDFLTSLPGRVAEAAPAIASAGLELGQALLQGIIDGVLGAVDIVGDLAGAIGDAAIDVINGIIDGVNEALQIDVDLPWPAGRLTFDPPNIPHLATGGLVTGPTLALVGEKGAELILPLNDPQRVAQLLNRYAPMSVPAFETGGAVDAEARNAAADATGPSGIEAWATAVTERLTRLPDEISAAMAPGMERWRLAFGAVLDRVALALSVWSTFTIPQATVPALRTWQAQVQSVLVAIAALFTAAVGVWGSLASQAARAYVTGATGKLRSGATTVADIVASYARRLVAGLNPILTAIGQAPIRLADGGVVAHAQGGIDAPHVAQIAPAGAWRVWAEPETGGEAYIPLARSKRPRSRAIASETVRRLGGDVAWYRAGGISGSTRGLDPRFLGRVNQWVNAVGRPFHITSGWRSVQQQQALYAAYLAGHGNLAAKPGSSMHNYGLAIDGPHWGSHNPGGFGLVYRVPGEPWHVEPVEARAWRGDTDATAFAPLPSPPKVGRTGWIADVAQAAMGHVYDKAIGWSSEALATFAADVTTGPLAAGPAVDIGRRMAAARGWTGPQWNALHQLWDNESGWNPFADNPNSSAYGIPQALPGSKMGSHGPDWRTNPATQIGWGLDYIGGRYHTPVRALAAWQGRSPHWYRHGGLAFTHARSFDNGGVLRPGHNLVRNDTGRDEHLVPAGSRGPAVEIGEAHFHEGVDYQAFLQKTAHMVKAGRL